MTLTPRQVGAIWVRTTLATTTIEVRPWGMGTRDVEVSQFERTRLIETVRIKPGGGVKVLP